MRLREGHSSNKSTGIFIIVPNAYSLLTLLNA